MATSKINKKIYFRRFLLRLGFCLKHVVLQIIQIPFSSMETEKKAFPIEMCHFRDYNSANGLRP